MLEYKDIIFNYCKCKSIKFVGLDELALVLKNTGVTYLSKYYLTATKNRVYITISIPYKFDTDLYYYVKITDIIKWYNRKEIIKELQLK
jgi:hypothetical protein